MPSRSEALIPLLPERYQHLMVLPTLEHALSLGPRLREADLREIHAAASLDGTAGLIVSLQNSALGWTFLHPESRLPHVMAGLALPQGQPGEPWALSAAWDKKTLRMFMDVYSIVIDYMHCFAAELSNFVDERNGQAIRWLQKAGFNLSAPQARGTGRFHQFSRSI